MTADRDRPRDTAPPDLTSLPPLTEGEVDGLERVTRAPCSSVVLPRDTMLRVVGDLRRLQTYTDMAPSHTPAGATGAIEWARGVIELRDTYGHEVNEYGFAADAIDALARRITALENEISDARGGDVP